MIVSDAKTIKLLVNKLLMTGLMKDRIIGPFFFRERTVTGPVYLDMLEQFVYPQVVALQPNVIFQQDGAPPHWSMDVRGPSMQNFLIDGLDVTDLYVGHHVPLI